MLSLWSIIREETASCYHKQNIVNTDNAREEGELEIVCDPFHRFYLEARGEAVITSDHGTAAQSSHSSQLVLEFEENYKEGETDRIWSF